MNERFRPKIQEMRDQTATDIKEIRKQRDDVRKQSRKPIQRIKGVLGFNQETHTADALRLQAKHKLSDQRRRISNKEQDLEEGERRDLDQKIRGALIKFGYPCEQPIDVGFFADNQEVFEKGFKDPHLGPEIITGLNSYFKRPAADLLESGEFNHRAAGLMADHFETIEGMQSSEDKYLNAMEAAVNIIQHGDEAHQLIGKELLFKSRGKILSELQHGGYHMYVSHLFEQSGAKERIEIEEKISQFVSDKKQSDRRKAELLANLLKDTNNREASAKAEEMMSSILEKIGIDGKKAISAWFQSKWDKEDNYTIRNNFEAVLELEKKLPGAAAWLSKEYGVMDFFRYPQELLEQQYRDREDKSKPYGIIVFPRSDHNGAFYQDKQAFVSMMKQLEGKYHLRVAEAESKTEVVRRLIKFNSNYGQISFAYLGGHGEKDQIQFGGSGGEGRFGLNLEDLVGKGAEKATKFFVEHPTIILASCSTGIEGGIGQKLSKKLGARLVAPETPTAISKVNITFESDRPDFKVEYHKKTEQYYDRGMKIAA